MANDIWLNLPVKDVKRSVDFFTKIGFSFNQQRTNANMGCMLVGTDNFVVMLFPEVVFKSFTQHPVSDTSRDAEVLISISASSKDAVDQLAKKVLAAGGKLIGPPTSVQGWMYGCGFTDLDGHRWNSLYMDYSKMPKQ